MSFKDRVDSLFPVLSCLRASHRDRASNQDRPPVRRARYRTILQRFTAPELLHSPAIGPQLSSFIVYQPHSWNELSDTRMELMKLRKPEMAPPGSPSQEPEPTIMTDLFGDHLQGYPYGGKVFFFKFLLGRGPFCGATGTLCFRLRMTLHMGFKARWIHHHLRSFVACTQ